MSDYCRVYIPGATYFFTVVTYQRKPLLAGTENIQRIKQALRHVRQKHPFECESIVVLPDHLHAMFRMPGGDADFSLRWRLIKHFVSIGSATRRFWQPRFWEHCIRNERDWERHSDYIHYNPVKHGLCRRPADWPHSSFAYWVRRGLYAEDWGETEEPEQIRGITRE